MEPNVRKKAYICLVIQQGVVVTRLSLLLYFYSYFHVFWLLGTGFYIQVCDSKYLLCPRHWCSIHVKYLL